MVTQETNRWRKFVSNFPYQFTARSVPACSKIGKTTGQTLFDTQSSFMFDIETDSNHRSFCRVRELSQTVCALLTVKSIDKRSQMSSSCYCHSVWSAIDSADCGLVSSDTSRMKFLALRFFRVEKNSPVE